MSQDHQSKQGNLAAPEVKKRKIWVELGKDQRTAGRGHVDHPGQNQVAGVAQHVIQLGRDKMIKTALEALPAEPADPLLDCAKRANPSTEYRAEEDCQEKANHHQDKGGFMDFLDKRPGCGKLIDRHDSTERAQGMQRGAAQEGDSTPGFCQAVVDGNQRDQSKEECLDDFPYPNGPGSKKTVAFSKQSDHEASMALMNANDFGNNTRQI